MAQPTVWTLKKKFRFEAAHKLPHHDGKCQRLHGHSWVGWVIVEGDKLMDSGAQKGMVLDYGYISSIVKPLVNEYLDHHYLNDTLGLENPTSEEVARWVFDQLSPVIMGLRAVVIEETCTSACIYAVKGPLPNWNEPCTE